jgi:hypothetical protein
MAEITSNKNKIERRLTTIIIFEEIQIKVL